MHLRAQIGAHMFISERFGITVIPITNPGVMPILTERTLIRTFEHLVKATRAFASHSLPNFTMTDNEDAFLVQANMHGRAVAFARLLAHEDRMSPLVPGVMPDISSEVNRSARGLIRLLSKWFEQLPAHPMNKETHEVFFLAVKLGEQPQGLDTTKLNAALGRLSGLIADLAPRMGLTEEACLERVIKVAGAVMPLWREWLGGIEPTDLPQI